MSRLNFIQTHLVVKIRKHVEKVFRNENYHGFLWLDRPIYDKNFVVNRLGTSSPFQLEEVVPLSWYALQPKTLLKVYKMLKNNEVYLHVKQGPYYIDLKPNELEECQ